MRRGYKSGASKKINKRAVLLTMGAVALLILLFFASFWITSAILKRGQDTPIPQQSDVASPEDSPNKVPKKTEPEKDVEVESQITDNGWGYIEPEKPKEEEKPEEAQKPAETQKPAEEKKPTEEKKPEQPSTPKEPESGTTPEASGTSTNPPAPEPPAQQVAPSKPPIEILPPNVTE